MVNQASAPNPHTSPSITARWKTTSVNDSFGKPAHEERQVNGNSLMNIVCEMTGWFRQIDTQHVTHQYPARHSPQVSI